MNEFMIGGIVKGDSPEVRPDNYVPFGDRTRQLSGEDTHGLRYRPRNFFSSLSDLPAVNNPISTCREEPTFRLSRHGIYCGVDSISHKEVISNLIYAAGFVCVAGTAIGLLINGCVQ